MVQITGEQWGIMRAESGVEPTRSQNITVSCRRSASAVAFAGAAAGTSLCRRR
jgi:hypothetical protein